MRRHDLDKFLPIGEAYRACRDRSTSGARTSTGERFLNNTGAGIQIKVPSDGGPAWALISSSVSRRRVRLEHNQGYVGACTEASRPVGKRERQSAACVEAEVASAEAIPASAEASKSAGKDPTPSVML